MRIGTRLVVSLILSITALMGFYRYWRLLKWHEALFAQQVREVRIVAGTLELAIANAVKRGRWEEVADLFREIEQLIGIDRVALLRADGSVLMASSPSAGGAAAGVSTIRQVLKETKPAGFFLTEENRGRFHYFTPMPLAGRGGPLVLEVVTSTRFVEQGLARRRNEIVFGWVFMVILVAGVTGYFTRRHISRPIEELLQGARAIGSGDLSRRIRIKRKDELGSLAAELNRMAEGLAHARDRLLEKAKTKLDLERQLQHAEKLAAVGRLAAGVAHEIGTPLNIVSGRAEYLLAEMEEGDPKARGLRVIITQIERIARIIQELLGYARVHPPQIAPSSLPRVVSNVLSLLDHEMERRGIQVQLGVPADLPALAADPHLLQQVFLNLLLNAFDAMPDGGRVHLASEAKDAWVVITVEDTGCGIPEEVLPRIFDPFFTTKRAGKGSGLGLSVVHGIIQSHGGRVEVRSEIGVGAAFVLHLPICSASTLITKKEEL